MTEFIAERCCGAWDDAGEPCREGLKDNRKTKTTRSRWEQRPQQRPGPEPTWRHSNSDREDDAVGGPLKDSSEKQIEDLQVKLCRKKQSPIFLIDQNLSIMRAQTERAEAGLLFDPIWKILAVFSVQQA